MRKRVPRAKKGRSSQKMWLEEWFHANKPGRTAFAWRHKPQRRRSKARLGKHKKVTPGFKATVLVPAQTTLRINGNTIFNVFFLAMLGWATTWFFISDQFYIDRVIVNGNKRVSTEAILEASGLQGYNIFWVNAHQVAATITESLPPVKRVRIKYGLPNVVNLTIEEQGEQIMWQIGENRYWVEDSGQLHLVQGKATPSILVRDIRPNLPDRVDPEAVTAARQLATLLPELKVVEYAPLTGLRFTHPRGWVVYLGTGSDIARKVNILRAIEAQFDREAKAQPTLIDLRFPDSPYYRLGGNAGGP